MSCHDYQDIVAFVTRPLVSTQEAGLARQQADSPSIEQPPRVASLPGSPPAAAASECRRPATLHAIPLGGLLPAASLQAQAQQLEPSYAWHHRCNVTTPLLTNSSCPNC